MKNDKNETEKLMDVRKKSLSPNKKSNAEPALKVQMQEIIRHHLKFFTAVKIEPCDGEKNSEVMVHNLQTLNQLDTSKVPICMSGKIVDDGDVRIQILENRTCQIEKTNISF